MLLPEWCEKGTEDDELVYFPEDHKVRTKMGKWYSKLWITDEYSNSGVKISDAIKPPPVGTSVIMLWSARSMDILNCFDHGNCLFGNFHVLLFRLIIFSWSGNTHIYGWWHVTSDTSDIRQNRSTNGLSAFDTSTFIWDTAIGKVLTCNKEPRKESYIQVCCFSKKGQNYYPGYLILTEKSVACLLALPEETLPQM